MSVWAVIEELRRAVTLVTETFMLREPPESKRLEMAGEELELVNPPATRRRAPRVYIGDLPPKREDNTAGRDFPFVVIRPTGGELPWDNPRKHDVHVTILCGVYARPGRNETPEGRDETLDGGMQDVLNLTSVIIEMLQVSTTWGNSRWNKQGVSWKYGEDEALSLWKKGAQDPLDGVFGTAIEIDFEGKASTPTYGLTL